MLLRRLGCVGLLVAALPGAAASAAAAAGAPEPVLAELSAPAVVRIPDHYSFTGASCGEGWVVTSVSFTIWSPNSHPPALPEPLSPTDISQTVDGIEIRMVAGETARANPQWYVNDRFQSMFYEGVSVLCERDGESVRATGSVTVYPTSGIAWSVSQIGAYNAAEGLGVGITSLDCLAGTNGTLVLNAVPGAPVELTAPLTAEAVGAQAQFQVSFAKGPAWAAVDYTFRCQTASGTATSSFVQPDWGFILAPAGQLPPTGGSVPPALAAALVCALGLGMRLVARHHHAV